MEDIEFRLQNCLIKSKSGPQKTVLNSQKLKPSVFIFCQLRGLHPDPVPNIPVVEEAKFLGLLFDTKLTFIPHIKALKAKCLNALYVLKVLSNTNWGGDRSVPFNLYRSLHRSKFDYGSVVYGFARKSYLKCIGTIHHQDLRLVLERFVLFIKKVFMQNQTNHLYMLEGRNYHINKPQS